MKRKNLLTILCTLWIMIAGCEVFPYVMETENPSLQPGQTQVTMSPTLESQPTATFEVPPEATNTAVIPTATLANMTVTATLIPQPIFKPQDGNPIYLPNFAHPESECQWLGIAGQIFDSQGFKVMELTLIAGDGNNAEEQPWSTQTGLAQAYGPGGYEIQISDIPQDTSGRFWVQVLDQYGDPLSERIFFTTFDDCSRNLVLLNFVFIDSGLEKAMPTPTLEAYP